MTVHPFFQKPDESKGSEKFVWLDPLGSSRSCLHGINLNPKSSAKIAAFDLDGTLIKPGFAKAKATPTAHWEWWRSSVPSKLREMHESG